MSATTSVDALGPIWLPAAEFRALGFRADGPEVDFGMRWGEGANVRVSYAPRRDQDSGFLYAHDAGSDRYLLLAAHTTAAEVDAAWHQLIECSQAPDAYLALTSLDHHELPMPAPSARGLLLHCVDREMLAHHGYVDAGGDPDARFRAANAVVIRRSARVAAEDLLHDAVKAQTGDVEPVVVRYRILGEAGWVGRVSGVDLAAAAAEVRHVDEVAHKHDLDLQATSVSQGRTIVAAPRVPELASVSAGLPVPANAPRLDI